jgi:prepilin-type N-terminal cleavage/methylation domain-containing protein
VRALNRSQNSARSGFTLIELIVVVAILALLMALILPAVQRMRTAGLRVQARADITELGVAAGNFAGTFGPSPQVSGGGPNGEFRLVTKYTDSSGNLLTDTILVGGVPTQRVWPEIDFLLTAFPNMNTSDNGLRQGGDGGPPVMATNPELLDGNQAMVFLLTGGVDCQFRGFSRNVAKPFTPLKTNPPPPPGTPPESRKGPFIEVQMKRVTDPLTQVVDGRFRDPWGTPYAVLSYANYAKGYPVTTWNGTPITCYGVSPFLVASNPTQFINGSTNQIISAGPNGKFGPGGPWVAGQGTYAMGSDGSDDISNFASAPLGSDAK